MRMARRPAGMDVRIELWQFSSKNMTLLCTGTTFACFFFVNPLDWHPVIRKNGLARQAQHTMCRPGDIRKVAKPFCQPYPFESTMKKKPVYLAALATLALGAAAHAQSSVTLYGRINTTVEYQDVQGADSQTGLHSNASFIGFKGTEDLGGGLKAGFVLEQQINATDGASTGFQRETHLSLSGGFGTLKAGNYNSAAYTYTADWVSLHNHDTGSSADALFAYIVPNKSKIGYITPSFGGFQLEVGFGFEDDHGGESPYDLRATYQYGGLDLGFGLAKWDDQEAYTLRALYSTGALTFGGYVQYDDNGFGLDLGDRISARLLAAYNVGASEFHVNVGWADDYDKVDESSAVQYTVAYNYNLSKRTKVYAFYTGIESDRNAVYGPVAGRDFSSLGLGIRHLF